MSGKESRIRNIVHTDKWLHATIDLSSQYHVVSLLKNDANSPDLDQLVDTTNTSSSIASLIEHQIRGKISGYKYQDIRKGIYCDASFVSIQDVYSTLVNSNYQCYYCKKGVHVLYVKAREPMQWTLERLDNQYGHNRDNVVVSCLHCNLCRKTMYHERFSFTKQMQVVKLE
uniref:Uncharacterized protein n=1 Tax=viral metagenome TaxID=1070528 RepID=A0A6C0I5K8_9ZZZZ